jgi:HD-GYP domain-containing protein (c-di-GMP phosphodiesterase class II)
MISQLRRLGVTMVFIQDQRFNDVVIEDVVDEQTKRDAMNHYSSAVTHIQGGKQVDTRQVSQVTGSLIDEIMLNKKTLVSLSDIRTNDNALFMHSVNVCILSVVIGMNLGLNRSQLSDLAVGALFHDIGKIVLPDSVSKGEDSDMPRNLSEEAKHTWRGYKRIRKNREFSIVSAHVALQHHENIDGSGFPRGLMGDDIHQFAKIVAVANTYDNLISGNMEKDIKPMLPDQATEYLMTQAGKTLDHEMVIQFLRAVAVYPTGMTVRLSSGQTGMVVSQHKGLPSRPVVRAFTRDEGDWNDHSFQEIDLAKETTVFIKKVITE